MLKKDKQILHDGALAIAEGIVAVFAISAPAILIAWGLSKALYGAGLKLRQKKALEWVEMVRENPSVFVDRILQNEKFQDGFVYALEKYIRERNEEKRKYMRNIFLGFSRSDGIDNFELERMYHVLNVLSSLDLATLRDVNLDRTDFYQVYDHSPNKNESIYNLINTGILMSDYSSRLGSIDAPFVKVSDFGRAFVAYINDDDK